MPATRPPRKSASVNAVRADANDGAALALVELGRAGTLVNADDLSAYERDREELRSSIRGADLDRVDLDTEAPGAATAEVRHGHRRRGARLLTLTLGRLLLDRPRKDVLLRTQLRKGLVLEQLDDVLVRF